MTTISRCRFATMTRAAAAFLITHVLCGAVVAGVTALLVSPLRAEPFTIVALPDTQDYTDDPEHLPYFRAQAEWIREQVEGKRTPPIVFVTHLGDVVQRAFRDVQYQRADHAVAPLEELVPWSVLPGNHDYEITGRKFTGTISYREHFGPARFAERPWFGGADPSGNNTFQIFEAGGRRFLHLALEWRPDLNISAGLPRDPAPLEWARGVLADHPRLPVILSTHEYLDDHPIGRSRSGNNLWNELIRTHDSIFLVLCGHNHSNAAGERNGEYMQISRNDAGRPVVEMLQNFQDYPNGGNGWLRLITLDDESDEIRVRTYSPALDKHQREGLSEVGPFASRFTVPMDLERRWTPPDSETELEASAHTTLRVGALSAISSSGGQSPSRRSARIDAWDTDADPTARAQVLLKFIDLESAPPSPGATLHKAWLVLYTIDPGDGAAAHRMLVPWDRDATWERFAGNGIQADGVEAAVVPDATVAGGGGRVLMDVTPSVRAWLRDPSTNNGLALLARGHDGWDIAAFGAPAKQRPRLVLIWSLSDRDR